MGMTVEQRLQVLEDIQAISELKAAYCNGADGVWDGGKIGRAEGREGIRELFTSFKRFPFAFHRVTNPIIKINGDTASGEWHFLVPITLDHDRARWFGGIYTYQFMRTPQGWKFKSLKATSAFVSKNEHGWQVG